MRLSVHENFGRKSITNSKVSQGKDVILYFARNGKNAETLAYNSSSDANPWPQAWLNP